MTANGGGVCGQMRRLVVLVIGLSFGAHVSASGQTLIADSYVASRDNAGGFRIVVASHLLQELGTLADTLNVETVRCLIGAVHGDSALVDMAWQPRIYSATETRVKYQTCPVATIALWHNHLRSAATTPAGACYLSATDIEHASKPGAPLVQIVQVSEDVICWWSRPQILAAPDESKLCALRGQRQPEPVDDVNSRCMAVAALDPITVQHVKP